MQDNTFDISSVSIDNGEGYDSSAQAAAGRAAAASAAARADAERRAQRRAFAKKKRQEFLSIIGKKDAVKAPPVDVTEYAEISNKFWTRNRILFAGGAALAIAAFFYFRRSR